MRTDDTSTDLTGSQLDSRYWLVRLIKVGGMGAVYEALDTWMERRCVIKLLLAKWAANDEIRERFLREAKIAWELRHPNIVACFNVGAVADGSAYLDLEFLVGDDLERHLKRRGPIPWSEVGPWMLQACSALAYAHERGFVHRDIKPSNFIHVESTAPEEPRIKLIDFGITRVTPHARLKVDADLTQHLMGTEPFMAPECFTAGTYDARTDIYALGVTMYRLLTHRFPQAPDPIPPSEASPHPISPAVDALVLKALGYHPLSRFASVNELADTLRGTLTPPAERTARRLPPPPPLPVAPAVATAILHTEDLQSLVDPAASHIEELQSLVEPAASHIEELQSLVDPAASHVEELQSLADPAASPDSRAPAPVHGAPATAGDPAPPPISGDPGTPPDAPAIASDPAPPPDTPPISLVSGPEADPDSADRAQQRERTQPTEPLRRRSWLPLVAVGLASAATSTIVLLALNNRPEPRSEPHPEPPPRAPVVAAVEAAPPVPVQSGPPSPPPAAPPPAIEAQPPPEFSPSEARKQLDALLPDLRRCGRRDQLFPGTTIRMRVTISPAGTATARLERLRGSNHARCIEQAIAAQRFPESTGGSLTYQFKV